MFITKKNYDQIYANETLLNDRLSEQTLELFRKLGIRNLNIAGVGNSLSSGYSKSDELIPFLMRCKLYSLADNLSFFSYARIRRNEDSNILKWYQSDIGHQEINRLLIDDIIVKKDTYVEELWSEETIKRYQQLGASQEIGFKSFNMLNDSIIIYNGFTGTFTDVLRKGDTKDKLKLLTCFQKDFEYAQTLLTQIYLDNPQTQVYVCGLPNLMGTGIISCFDKKIKKLCRDLPNTVYLPGTLRSYFFKLEGQKTIDVHYNKPEYLQLWNHILSAMIESYLPTKFISSLLSKIESYHLQVEQESTVAIGSEQEIYRIIDEELEKYRKNFEISGQDINDSLQKAAFFYDKHYLETFACTPRQKVLAKMTEKS